MNENEKNWEQIKTDYLEKVKTALSSVNHPRSDEVLEDVRRHLDRRFEELPPEKRDWENFQAIISDMGPPSDYAELLGGQKPQGQKLSAGFLTAAVIIFAAVAIAIIALPLLHKQDGKVYKTNETKVVLPVGEIAAENYAKKAEHIVELLGQKQFDNVFETFDAAIKTTLPISK